MVIERTYVTAHDGCRLAVYHHPQPGKPTLMFSSSLGTDYRMWRPQMERFEEDYSLLLYDMRGHGQSDAPPGGYSIDRLAQDVLAILDALKLNQAHFCGLSIGGMIGQRLAWLAPERFASLTLAATSAYMGPPQGWQERIELVTEQGMEALLERIRNVWFTPALQAEHPEGVDTICQHFLATNPHGYSGCCAAIRDMDQRASARLNQLPTLIIAGTEDQATPPEHAEFLHRNMSTSRLELLDGAHLVNLQQHETFSQLLHDFIQSNLVGQD